MGITANLMEILDELRRRAGQIDDDALRLFVSEISRARRIFAAGAGRSGLAVRAFAMRLMHLGKAVHVLGDATTPSIGKGDLLLVGSGSGETKSLVAAAEKARACGARIALNTMDDTSALGRLADVAVVLPGHSPKLQNSAKSAPSVQPMGSAYEQLSLLVYDAVIMDLMAEMGQTEAEMFARHANLE